MPTIVENGLTVHFERQLGGKVRIQVPQVVPPIDLEILAHDWVNLIAALSSKDDNRSAAIAAALHGV